MKERGVARALMVEQQRRRESQGSAPDRADHDGANEADGTRTRNLRRDRQIQPASVVTVKMDGGFGFAGRAMARFAYMRLSP